jgi:hypothetical protein
MAVMIVSILMQRLEKSTLDCIVPMQAIAVIPLVLCELAKSITFSEVAFTSLKSLVGQELYSSVEEKQTVPLNWPQV